METRKDEKKSKFRIEKLEERIAPCAPDVPPGQCPGNSGPPNQAPPNPK
jgi:hypothetical protein